MVWEWEQRATLSGLVTPAHCGGLAWLDTRCPAEPLYIPPSSAGQGRGNVMRVLWIEIRTGRDHSPITVISKTWGN